LANPQSISITGCDFARHLSKRLNTGMEAPATTKESSTSAQQPLVLVIDDDRVMRELLALHLSNAGYRVLAADDGITGGYLALSDKPDLVIVDVDMPHMTGYQLVEALKGDSLTRHIPVIFLTSREDVDDHARKLGAEAYLRKPVKADRLLQVVALFSP
jgi:CheY-like chemotaxis protein